MPPDPSGWPWPLNGVQWWFENLFNSIATLVKPLIDWLWNAIKPVLEGLFSAISAVGTWIMNQVKPVLGPIADWVSKAASLLVTTFLDFTKDPIGFIQRGVNFVGQMLQQAWNSLAAGINAVGSSLTSALGAVRDALTGAITGIATTVSSVVGGAVNTLATAFNGAVSTLGSWVSDALKGMASALGEALQAFIDWLAKGVATVAPVVLGFLQDHIITPLLGAFNWIRDRVTDVLRGFHDAVVSMFRGVGAGTPEGAAALGVPLLLISTGGSFALGALGAVAGLKVVGTGIESEAVVDCLRDAFSLAEISKSVFAPIITAAYSGPITYFYNAMFRPAIPSTGQADDMLFHGNIDDAAWHQIYAYHGWKDADINAWRRTMARVPNQRTLLTMLEDPEIPEDWVRLKLRENHFDGEDIEVLIGYKRRLIHTKAVAALDSDRNKLRDNAKSDLVKGYITEQDLRGALEALGYSADVIEYHVQDAIQDRERKRRDLQVSTLQDAYVKGEIQTEDELTSLLTEYIVVPGLVSAMVDDAYVRRYKKPKAG